MKIVVLGNKGMLGSYVYNYFISKQYEVVGYNRENFDAVNFEMLPSWGFKLNENDIVINCIGVIKPKLKNQLNAIIVNSAFPHVMQDICEKNGAKFIHITTDCVFSGNKGDYCEADIHDVTDDYGRTKSLGEPLEACVIRTSIIGEEVGKGFSLLNWVISNKAGKINGYINHYWNGVTCLELAKIIESIIKENKFWKGVRHVFTNIKISKYNLCKLISDVYELGIDVEPILYIIKCDRSLRTIHEIMQVPDYKEQLNEQKEFFNTYIKE